MSANEDQARVIAERVARRLANESPERGPALPTRNGEDQSSENRRARIINFVSPAAPPRTPASINSQADARIDIFEAASDRALQMEQPFYPQVAQSPWLAPFASSFGATLSSDQTPPSALRTSDLPNHPSQERFGVDEAAVSELVEFFEAEKQCSVDPSGKPCDHCAMCSSRGF